MEKRKVSMVLVCNKEERMRAVVGRRGNIEKY